MAGVALHEMNLEMSVEAQRDAEGGIGQGTDQEDRERSLAAGAVC